MKKPFILTLTLIMVLNLIACGGAPASADPGYTPEQQALAGEFSSAVDEFNAVADRINANPELLKDQEMVASVNELSAVITEADGLFADPRQLTVEVMNSLKESIAAIKQFNSETHAILDSQEGGASELVVPVEIINLTGVDIYALALSPANNNEWGENLISEVIEDGDTVLAQLVFTADTLVWDILVQDAEESQLSFMGIDFANASMEGATLVLEATEGGEYTATLS